MVKNESFQYFMNFSCIASTMDLMTISVWLASLCNVRWIFQSWWKYKWAVGYNVPDTTIVASRKSSNKLQTDCAVSHSTFVGWHVNVVSCNFIAMNALLYSRAVLIIKCVEFHCVTTSRDRLFLQPMPSCATISLNFCFRVGELLTNLMLSLILSTALHVISNPSWTIRLITWAAHRPCKRSPLQGRAERQSWAGWRKTSAKHQQQQQHAPGGCCRATCSGQGSQPKDSCAHHSCCGGPLDLRGSSLAGFLSKILLPMLCHTKREAEWGFTQRRGQGV